MKNKKILAVFSTSLLCFQAFLPPLNLAVADSLNDNAIAENEKITTNYYITEENTTESPTFSFEKVNTPILVDESFPLVFISNQEVTEVVMTLPSEAEIVLKELAPGIKVLESQEKATWIVTSEEPQNNFSIPIVFKHAGTHEISVGDEKISLEVKSNESSQSNEENVTIGDSESSFTDTSSKNENSSNDESQLIQDTDDSITEETEISDENLIPDTEKETDLSPITKADTTVQIVGTWEEFVLSFNDSNIDEIQITKDLVAGEDKLNPRSKSIKIDGNNHSVDFKDQQIVLNANQGEYLPRDSVFKNLTIRSSNNKGIIFIDGILGIDVYLENISVEEATGTPFYGSAASFILTGGTFNIFSANNISPDFSTFVCVNLTLKNSSEISTDLSLQQPDPVRYRILPMTTTISEGSVVNLSSTRATMASLQSNYINLVDNGSGLYIDSNTSYPAVARDEQIFEIPGADMIRKLNIELGSGTTFEVSTTDQVTISNLDNLDISNGAIFDIKNIDGKEAFQSNAENNNVKISTKNLAIWHKGKSIVDKINPNYIFNDLEANLEGENAKSITEVNNNLFKSVFSKQGLLAYSRITNKTGFVTDQNPVDPEAPEDIVDPNNPPIIPDDQGELRIEFASQFDFGEAKVVFEEQTIGAKQQGLNDKQENRPNYVQLVDNREQMDGWTLSVTQKEQFKTKDGNKLDGAQINFDNVNLFADHDGQGEAPNVNDFDYLLPGVTQPILTANNEQGKGRWLYTMGTTDNSGVFLTIPEGVVPLAQTYSAIFVWELNMTPQ